MAKDKFLSVEQERNVARLVPEYLQKRIQEIPDTWWDIPPDEVEQFCFDSGQADETSRRLRISFWVEYDRCQSNKDVLMNMDNVFIGICANSYFANIFLQNKRKLFYLLSVPPQYEKELDEMLCMGLDQLKRILAMDATGKNGQPNTKLMDLKFKIFQHIDMRKKGAIIQRIQAEQKNLNVNVDGKIAKDGSVVPKGDEPRSLEEIQKEIEQLEQRAKNLEAPKVVIDLLARPEAIDNKDLKFQMVDKYKQTVDK